MARRRNVAPTTAHGVPPELADPDHKVWRSREATEALVARYGLEPHWNPAPPSALRDPDFERFKAVRRAWATRAGMLTTWGTPDRHQLEAAGVYAVDRGPRRRGEHGTVDLGARRLIVD